jgi:hypothetical protein
LFQGEEVFVDVYFVGVASDVGRYLRLGASCFERMGLELGGGFLNLVIIIRFLRSVITRRGLLTQGKVFSTQAARLIAWLTFLVLSLITVCLFSFGCTFLNDFHFLFFWIIRVIKVLRVVHRQVFRRCAAFFRLFILATFAFILTHFFTFAA